LKQLLAGAFGDDLARGKDVVTGGHLKDRADFLFNQEKGDSKVADLNDLFKHIFPQDGGQPGGGFINTHQFWPRHQCPSEGQHLLLPAGEGSGDLVGPLIKHGE